MRRIFDCGVLLRVFILVLCALYAYTGLTQPESLIYQVAHADSFTRYTMTGLAVLTALGVVDLFVNDLMPDRFVIARALRDRHLVNMALAMCFAVQLWTCIRYDLPNAIVPFYAVYILFIPLSAFADVRKRYKTKAPV
jgi:hypothetical protein